MREDWGLDGLILSAFPPFEVVDNGNLLRGSLYFLNVDAILIADFLYDTNVTTLFMSRLAFLILTTTSFPFFFSPCEFAFGN